MTSQLQRRDFITGTVAAAAAISVSTVDAADSNKPTQEFYELRIYQTSDADKQAIVQKYVESALIPALNRAGIDRVGVFTPLDEKTSGVYLVIPYRSLDQLATLNDTLAGDAEYRKAAADYLAISKSDAAYSRIESRLLKAFAGMPTMVLPSKESADRLIELRIYQSHNEEMARLKVEMFNEGEIDIMKKVKLGPVFFGETLISGDVPNLTYMLSAESDAAHKEHWSGFRTDPDWDRMKQLDRYKDTVSKIISVMLKPAPGSQV
jgi:hypothetical protein